MKLSRIAAVAALALSLALPALAQSPQTSPQTPAPRALTPQTATQTKLLDINSASAADLDALPGVGKSRAQAIISNRPYKGKDDLVQRKIIPQNVYDGIKDRIVARQK